MPFSKYFQDDPLPADHHSANGLQFQLPSFIQTGAPTLALGGGAEVVTFNSTWCANNNSSSNGYYTSLPPGLSAAQPTISAPSPLGLPVYSASGFDLLSILTRVVSRPNPRIVLGPVDMTCSFVVVDIRRHDQPIVYCSPTFCRLTGYPEHEVLGRNCRFLQAPPSSGPVRAGEPRRFTSQASVDTMRKALIANKEVQTSIVNFRKDGSAFINLVSVIPIFGGERGTKHELNDVVYHVGFQVDLTEQPNAILVKLRDGSYSQNTLPLGPAAPYNDAHVPSPPNHTQHDLPPPPPQRKQQLPALLMAPSLAQALTNPAFHRDLPITTSTTAPSPLPPASSTSTSTSSTVPASTANNPLSLILLEYAPDFILVVSLKGAFLYVAPAVSHVLGHSPSALVGRSISDLAHPEDVVPLERQLKESSTLINVTVPSSPPAEHHRPHHFQHHHSHSHHHHHQSQQHAKLIDVLFRARTAGGSYVWVEARGRLHVEPGKGRKAIVLSARARRMPRVRWGDLLPPLPTLPTLPPVSSLSLSSPLLSVSGSGDSGSSSGSGCSSEVALAKTQAQAQTQVQGHGQAEAQARAYECWAQLSGLGAAAGAIVSIGSGVEGVLGCAAGDVLGRRISRVVVEEDRERVEGVLRGIERRAERGRGEGRVVLFVRVRMGTGKEGEGEVVRVRLAFYPSCVDEDGEGEEEEMAVLGIAPPIVLLHIARGEGIDNLSPVSASAGAGAGAETQLHDPEENVFAELEVRRGSSWQYELQQLRFRNVRLREEVRALEREVRAFEGGLKGVGEGAGVGAEGEEGVAETGVMGEGTAPAGNVYPPPQFASSDGSVGNLAVAVGEQEGNAFGYDAQTQTQPQTQPQMDQTHANYTAALERYASDGGAAYEGLEMALGMGGAMGMGMGTVSGMGMGMGAGGMGLGIESPVATYALPQSHAQDHRSSFHISHGHNQPQQHQQQHQQQQHQQHAQQLPTQNTMYAPQPVHSHSHASSGLLHALGQPASVQHHNQQQPQRMQNHVPRVRAYDPRSQAQHAQRVDGRRGESVWGAMHPGVKRSFGR